MRVEWTKLQARAERYREEKILVAEEMRRTLVYCDWKADWWRTQSSLRADAGIEVLSGLQAYAEKQAVMWESLGISFASSWYKTLVANGHETEWPERYRIAGENPKLRMKRTTLALARSTRPSNEMSVSITYNIETDQQHAINDVHSNDIIDEEEFATTDYGEDDDNNVPSEDEYPEFDS